MSNRSRSPGSIRLNTHLHFLQDTAADRIRPAPNDKFWGLEHALSAADHQHSITEIPRHPGYSHTRFQALNDPIFPAASRESLCAMRRNRELAVIDLITQHIEQSDPKETRSVRLLELGCRKQQLGPMLGRYYDSNQINCLSVDKDIYTNPDVHIDIGSTEGVRQLSSLKPDIVIVLDPLPLLENTEQNWRTIIANIAAISIGCSLLVMQLPLSHRQQAVATDFQQDWLDTINEYLIVEKVIFDFGTDNHPHGATRHSAVSNVIKRLKRRLSSQSGNSKMHLVLASSRYTRTDCE